ncbi:MAG: DUF2493 domain-containing protein [Verrucomicrobia bacterium]|nr:DUF2493 domain-containing protein [Cytophagales bacterium]
MKLAVSGSRTILVSQALLDFLNEWQPETVITGGAVGVDVLAEKWATENSKKLLIKKPEYSKYGKTAPMVRNSAIVKECDALIAVWDGKSKGTQATIKMAKRAGKLLKVILELENC